MSNGNACNAIQTCAGLAGNEIPCAGVTCHGILCRMHKGLKIMRRMHMLQMSCYKCHVTNAYDANVMLQMHMMQMSSTTIPA